MQSLQIVFLMVLAGTQAFTTNFGDQQIHLSQVKLSYNDKLKTFLDVTVREFLRTGNASMGIPIIDPFVKDEFLIDLDEDLITMVGSLVDMKVDDLSKFIINKATLAVIPPKLTLELTFPKIFAKGLYKIDGTVTDNISVYGDGAFDATFNDFVFNTVIKFALNGAKLTIKSIDFGLSLETLDFLVTGFFNDEPTSVIMSELISDMTPQLITDYEDNITETMSTYAKDFLNLLLADMSLQDLLAVLG